MRLTLALFILISCTGTSFNQNNTGDEEKMYWQKGRALPGMIIKEKGKGALRLPPRFTACKGIFARMLRKIYMPA